MRELLAGVEMELGDIRAELAACRARQGPLERTCEQAVEQSETLRKRAILLPVLIGIGALFLGASIGGFAVYVGLQAH